MKSMSMSMRSKIFVKKIDDTVELFDSVDLGDFMANYYLETAAHYMSLAADCLESSGNRTVKLKSAQERQLRMGTQKYNQLNNKPKREENQHD